MWVGLIESVEDLNRTKDDLSEKQKNLSADSFGVELQLFLCSPACWTILQILGSPSLHNHMS